MIKRIVIVLIFGILTSSSSSWGRNQLEYTNDWIGDSSSLEIYPNPAVEYVNIRQTQFNGEASRLEIMDLSGESVYHINEIFTELSIYVGNWRKGVYMIHFNQGESESLQKVIVQ